MIATPHKILMVAAEMVPFAKTGGLADVVGALPKALKAQGYDVRVAIPRYGRIDPQRFHLTEALGTYIVTLDDEPISASMSTTTIPSAGGDVPIYFVENEQYFQRDGIYMYEDDADRFIFFCRAVLEGVRLLDWQPDVIHCHDWHTAIIPNWLRTTLLDDPFFHNTASVYTIHNLAYQGIFGYRVLEIAGVDEFGFIADPHVPHLNDVVDFMGRGIYFADIVNTVSETYAKEILTPEFGEGLDPILQLRDDRLYGVLNGIDDELNNPATDTHLAATYDREHLAGKALCKADLQREAHLPQNPKTPVIAAISRLADQKGFDLITAMADDLLQNQDLQLIILGTGNQRYHDLLTALRARFPRQVSIFFTFNATLAQKIYAGADAFLMPSRMEPCGLGQMIALRYGTLPIVRATGGLADTVQDYDPTTGKGNGFSFAPYDAQALRETILRAIQAYHEPQTWDSLIDQAMQVDHSWAASARRYGELYRKACELRTS